MFERLGSSRTLKSDAPSDCRRRTRDLAEMVADHEFRADLFYRLNVFPIQLPPPKRTPRRYSVAGCGTSPGSFRGA